jgi:hypothetical protein
MTATRSADAAGYSVPRPLSATGANAGEAAMGTDAQGDVTVAWARSGTIQADVLETGGPALDALSVPETTLVGQAITVSVAPRDARSALGTTTWRFGDGSGATGNTATHAYAGPGSYRVRVSAADVNGNSTSATRTVIVTETASVLPDTTAPRITKAKLDRTRIRPAVRGGVLGTRADRRRGATLSFQASEAGSLAITIERRVSGRRVGKRCSATAKRGTRCTLFRAVATGKTNVAAGAVRRFLNGRKVKGRLARGRYRLGLVLTDAAKNPSPAVTLSFSVR